MSELDHIRGAIEALDELQGHYDEMSRDLIFGEAIRDVRKILMWKLRECEKAKCKAIGWHPYGKALCT